ncbi:hypothetical protein AYO38_10470 [bacterium SCGC AG-212-C10]|nr:hypothetical protein AYO38_10470 [bacterium SCGC AG-212-C10]
MWSAIAGLFALAIASVGFALGGSEPAQAKSVAAGWGNLSFQQTEITVLQGDTVTWTNHGDRPHAILQEPRVTPGGGWGSEVVPPGGSYSHLMEFAGDFPFIDPLFPFLQGVVHVVEVTPVPTQPATDTPVPTATFTATIVPTATNTVAPATATRTATSTTGAGTPTRVVPAPPNTGTGGGSGHDGAFGLLAVAGLALIVIGGASYLYSARREGAV